MTGTVRPLARGVWGVLTTPFDADGHLDHASLRNQVALYRQVGASGVVALGVLGEAAKLDTTERAAVARTVREAAGPLPMVIGLTARSTEPAIEDAMRAVEATDGHLDGVMLQVNTSDADRLSAHLQAVHEASGVGIVVQDYPLVTGVDISSSGLATAIEQVDGVAGIKAEAPPTPSAIAALCERSAASVFGGLGGVGLLDELAAGAAGAMTGFSYPEGLVATVQAFEEQGFDAAREVWSRWLPLATFEGQAGVALALRKELLRRRGVLAHATIRPPGAAIPPSMLPLIDHHLRAVSSLA